MGNTQVLLCLPGLALDTLTPRERAIGLGEQFSLFISIKAEGLEQTLLFSHDLPGHELAYAYHLIPMTGISNQIAVLPKDVEDGEIVGCKGP